MPDPTTLYLEPYSGCSGDMFLGALAGLLDDASFLRELPNRMGFPRIKVELRDVDKSSIRCLKVDIIDPEPEHHPHRHLGDVVKILDAADLPPAAIARAKEIFRYLAEAEAGVHGTTIEQVHFHEVGAIDAMCDIAGTAWLLEELGVDACFCDPVRTGFGFVEAAHGTLPVPAPATARLLAGMPTFKGDVEGEMTTPTGAAILKQLAPEFTTPALRIARTAYGAGTAEFKHPNALRASVVDTGGGGRRTLILLQCQVDDSTGEMLGGFCREAVEQAGARDIWYTAVHMKKDRPGWLIEALADPADADAVSAALLEHTGSIGVRRIQVERDELPRQAVTLQTPWGRVAGKRVTLPSGRQRLTPEYDACEALAREHGIPVLDVLRAANG